MMVGIQWNTYELMLRRQWIGCVQWFRKCSLDIHDRKMYGTDTEAPKRTHGNRNDHMKVDARLTRTVT